MAGVIAPASAKPSLAARLWPFLAEQLAAQTLRWRMWAPVAFGGGCASYFALKSEPPLWPLVAAAVGAVAAWQMARRSGRGRLLTLPLMLLACFALGVAVTKLRTEAVAAPIAPAMEQPTIVEGWVIDVDSPGGAGPRVVLAPVRIRGLTPEETPMRLRATVRGEAPAPGQ
ncbi:MAG TPA: competence protein ComEC, partial [Brevundimonas sp.]|nr:competence protein ComEC [Brevundimonas sp.]